MVIEGDFIRVREDNENVVKRGKDGLVVEVVDESRVALIFGCDRHGVFQDVQCVGPELWNLDELDLESITK